MVGTVGAAKGIAGPILQLVVHRLEVALREHYVAVQHYQPLALAALGTIVARLAGAAVRFRVILHREAVCIVFCHVAAGHAGAVLDHNDLKVRQCLAAQARE